MRIGKSAPWCACVMAVMVFCGASVRADDLLKNGDFTQEKEGKPVAWKITENPQKVTLDKPEGKSGALKIEIVQENGKNLGEIGQTIKIQKNKKYRVSADLMSSKPGVGLVMIKPRQGRKELDRITLGVSATEWKTYSKEFESGNADDVQVLVRFVQKPEMVGESCWFSGIKLELIGDGTAAAAAAPVEPAIAPPSTDQYVTVTGAGDKSGRDWANARAAASGGLQSAIDAAGSGNTLYIGSGTYEGVALNISAGGSSSGALKTIAGKDTGSGLPLFRSDFDKSNPARTGATLFNLPEGISYVQIKDIKVEDYRIAVILRGQNRGVRIDNVDVTRCRDAFWIEGGAIAGQNDSGTRDLLVQNCDVKFYTKRLVRMMGGVSQAQFINCHGDAGGKDWATEPFQMGFQISTPNQKDVTDHHITFTDCSAANSYNEGKGYWNGDGFCSELAASDLIFIRCSAFNNTDGGWDIKSPRCKWIDCIAIGNKRNYRIWLQPGANATFMENCLSAFATDRGNLKHYAGYWFLAGGDVTMTRCTAWGDPVALSVETKDPSKGTRIVLNKCLLSPENGALAMRLVSGVDVQKNDSVVSQSGGTADFKLKSPTVGWAGGDDSFNCISNSDMGYYFRSAGK